MKSIKIDDPKIFPFFIEEQEVKQLRSYFHIFRNLQVGQKLAVRGDDIFISGSEMKHVTGFSTLNECTLGLANKIGSFLSRKYNGDNLQKTITFFSNIEDKITKLSEKLESNLKQCNIREDKIELLYEIQLLQSEIKTEKSIIPDQKDPQSSKEEIDSQQKSQEEETRIYLQNFFSQKKEIKKDLETGFQNLLTTYKTDTLVTQLFYAINSLKQKATAFCEKFLNEN